MTELVLVGRSSSHYTRVARMFALELGVPCAFRPVLDLMSIDPAMYAGNPALKIPVLVDDGGPLFGVENICRELARRSAMRARVVLRGDMADRLIANAEELMLHAMSTHVNLVMTKVSAPDREVPAKLARSFENSLTWLDGAIDRVLEVLPADRVLSFVEVGLFCTVMHLPFRLGIDTSGYARLSAFCARFGARESARQTEYRFDAA